ncbi:MAG TPA: hypothetical protein VGW38_14105, partial [Chloroflexota bacterium]|nr:hypothetical protein [Chloroflexota bacterium]
KGGEEIVWMARWWPFGRRVVESTEAVPIREEQSRDDDRGWRTVLTGGTAASERGLSDRRELLREAYAAYTSNPLAYAVIEQQTNFVLGGGAKVVAADKRVQRVVERFRHDSENRMDLRIYSIQTELALFGEQFIRFYVDALTGRVVIRQLDPLHVTAIETDPEDVERAVRYLYSPPGGAGRPTTETGGWESGAGVGAWIGRRVDSGGGGVACGGEPGIECTAREV